MTEYNVGDIVYDERTRSYGVVDGWKPYWVCWYRGERAGMVTLPDLDMLDEIRVVQRFADYKVKPEFEVGDMVRHPVYGIGLIRNGLTDRLVVFVEPYRTHYLEAVADDLTLIHREEES